MTTVRGITSRVDIVWSSDDMLLKRTESANPNFITGSAMHYEELYTITQLKDIDTNRTFQCEMVINSNPPVRAFSVITLDVVGKYYPLSYSMLILLIDYAFVYHISCISVWCIQISI